MEPVLLLTQGFEPVSIINWKRAVCLVFLEKAEVIQEYDLIINSPSMSIKHPAVIRLLSSFKRIQREVALNKYNIFARDNWTCQYCRKSFGTDDLTLDHIIPRAKGGYTTWENVVACCPLCNGKKGNRTPPEAGLQLMKKPTKPGWLPFLRTLAAHQSIPSEWKVFFNF